MGAGVASQKGRGDQRVVFLCRDKAVVTDPLNVCASTPAHFQQVVKTCLREVVSKGQRWGFHDILLDGKPAAEWLKGFASSTRCSSTGLQIVHLSHEPEFPLAFQLVGTDGEQRSVVVPVRAAVHGLGLFSVHDKATLGAICSRVVGPALVATLGSDASSSTRVLFRGQEACELNPGLGNCFNCRSEKPLRVSTVLSKSRLVVQLSPSS